MSSPIPCSAILLLLAGPALASPADTTWNRFRGPNGSGVAAAEARPPVKPDGAQPTWRTPVPPGLSSPVLADGRIFLTGVENGRLLTLACDARTGRVLWQRMAPEVPLEKLHAANSPATPTPLVEDGRVYVYFGSFGLLCYDTAGGEIWQRPLPTPASLYGMATSPISHGEHLLLVLDNDDNLPDSKLSQSKLVALKKSTGETVWETPRPFLRSGWSTPTLWTHESGEDLVVLGSGRVTGYDPATGAEKWYATGFSRETIAVPVADRSRVYVAAAMLGGVSDAQPDPEPFWKAMLSFDQDGDGRIARSEITAHFTWPLRPELPPEHPGFGIPLPDGESARKERQEGIFAGMDKDKDGYCTREELIANLSFQRGKPLLLALKPGGTGDVTATHTAWELNRGVPEIPSPVLCQDRIWMVRNGGLLSCVDAATGNQLFNERLNSPGQFSASPVIAGGQLYLLSNRGQLSVVQTADTFTLVHQTDLGEPAFVTPAIDADTLYIRTEGHLAAWRSGDP